MRKSFKVSIAETAFPEKVSGSVTEVEDGEYIICLHKGMTEDERTAAFLHEMLHIYHDDFRSGLSVRQNEAERHAELERLLTILAVQ